jgi:hypothetical protein
VKAMNLLWNFKEKYEANKSQVGWNLILNLARSCDKSEANLIFSLFEKYKNIQYKWNASLIYDFSRVFHTIFPNNFPKKSTQKEVGLKINKWEKSAFSWAQKLAFVDVKLI